MHNEFYYHPCKHKGYEKRINSLISTFGMMPVSRYVIESNRNGHVRQVKRAAWWFFSVFMSSDYEVPSKRDWNYLTVHLYAAGSNSFPPDGTWTYSFYISKNCHLFHLSWTAQGFTSVQTQATPVLRLLASLKCLLNWEECHRSSKWSDWILISLAPLTDFWN